MARANDINLPCIVTVVGMILFFFGALTTLDTLKFLWPIGIFICVGGVIWAAIRAAREGTPDFVILGEDGKPRSTVPDTVQEKPQFSNLRY